MCKGFKLGRIHHLWLITFIGLLSGPPIFCLAQTTNPSLIQIDSAETHDADQAIIPQKPSSDEAIRADTHSHYFAIKKQALLDKLFFDLKRAADVKIAAKISRQIQGLWDQSGSDTTDLLMQWAEKAIDEKNYVAALDFLNNVVALSPHYSEGWMRRAAVHMQVDDIAFAMLDLNHVLQCEPRNYNALALLGSIMEMTNHKDLAIDAYSSALALYPQMPKWQSRLSALIDQQTDRAT